MFHYSLFDDFHLKKIKFLIYLIPFTKELENLFLFLDVFCLSLFFYLLGIFIFLRKRKYCFWL